MVVVPAPAARLGQYLSEKLAMLNVAPVKFAGRVRGTCTKPAAVVVPVLVVPSLRVTDQGLLASKEAATYNVTLVMVTPSQRFCVGLTRYAVGLMTVAIPVKSEAIAEQPASDKPVSVYEKYVNVCDTGTLNVPLPVPVAVVPLFRVSVHAPVAVMLPAMVVVLPEQIELSPLVIAAVGRLLSCTSIVSNKLEMSAAQPLFVRLAT